MHDVMTSNLSVSLGSP